MMRGLNAGWVVQGGIVRRLVLTWLINTCIYVVESDQTRCSMALHLTGGGGSDSVT